MQGKRFIYTDYEVTQDQQTVLFRYQIDTDEQQFNLEESLRFPITLQMTPEVSSLLRALHIALGISYYKTFIPPEIVHPYDMDAHEATFWNTIFLQGLGEFMYKNNIERSAIAAFSMQHGQKSATLASKESWEEQAIIGIGGGKDSIVAGELLRQLDIPMTGFVLATGENRGQAQAVADVMGIELHGVERRLDPQILDMNNLPGALNGHIPVSLIFALVGCIVAATQKTPYVIVANEASASIPQTMHQGVAVNHQWSKSLEFERAFQSYIHDYVSLQMHYFSLIRSLTSVAVTKLFARSPQYLEVFTSDNSVFTIKQAVREHPRWSTKSPKSLSSYILLAPWLSDEQLVQAFGRNLLDNIELEGLAKNLLGIGNEPVLDCVGTPNELRLSLQLLRDQQRHQDSALVQKLASEDLTASITLQDCLKLGPSAIPAGLDKKLNALLKELLI